MENLLRLPKAFKGIMCQSPNEIQMKQVLIFLDLGLFLWFWVFLTHALPFTAQRSPVSISLSTWRLFGKPQKRWGQA